MKKYKIKSKDGKKEFVFQAENEDKLIVDVFNRFFEFEEFQEINEIKFPCAFVGINQKDTRWKNKFIGYSKSTIGDYGCLLSAICSHSFWACLNLTPDVLAKKFKFTSDGRLLWQSINNSGVGLEFVWRYYSFDENKILEILRSEKGLCEIEVNYGRGKHWIALTGYKDGKFYAYDPLRERTVDVFKVYKKITGFAELKVK